MFAKEERQSVLKVDTKGHNVAYEGYVQNS